MSRSATWLLSLLLILDIVIYCYIFVNIANIFKAMTVLSIFSPLMIYVFTAEGSTCVLLCLAEPLTGVRSALLASLMDMVQNQSSPELLSPLTQSDSLKVLQSSQETHLLQLLMPETDPQTSTAAHGALCAVKVQTKYCIYASLLFFNVWKFISFPWFNCRH